MTIINWSSHLMRMFGESPFYRESTPLIVKFTRCYAKDPF